jgi:hypothetical protein
MTENKILDECYIDRRQENNPEDIEDRVYIRLQHKLTGFQTEGYDRIRHEEALLERLTKRIDSMLDCFRQWKDDNLFLPDREEKDFTDE